MSAVEKKEFKAQLPARISGLVFWGLTLIGIFVALIAIGELESNLTHKNKSSAHYLTQSIVNAIGQEAEYPAIEEKKGRILLVINSLRDAIGFVAVSLYEGDFNVVSGLKSEDDQLYPELIHYHQKSTGEKRTIRLYIYFPNEKKTISELRRNILLFVGVSVFIFGYFLQKVLLLLISRPFLEMVETAEQFTYGNKQARFNEKRQDEFGYLGGFINRAINKLLSQQEKLNEALLHVEHSEKELRLEKERAEVTLTSITDAVITVDPSGKIIFLNPSAENLLGVTVDEEELSFDDLVTLRDDVTGESISNLVERCAEKDDVIDFIGSCEVLKKEGAEVAVEATISPMRDDHGKLVGMVIVIQDVSHTVKLTRQLTYQASHDMLTGLYNRRKFEEILRELIEKVREDRTEHTFCYLDLDQFKIVNDTCGHIAGDELLRRIPDLFHQVLRSGDILARLGGDEFGVLLENCNVDMAAQISEKLRQTIKEFRFNWDDKVFEIGVSIGVVGITAENADMTEILSTADVACYAAKDSGRNRVHIYESQDKTAVLRHGEMHWTSRIQAALKNDRMVLHQQPIVSTSGSGSKHCEVLVRMLDDDGSIVPPGAFLPAAERYNLINSIDRWVISSVFKIISVTPSLSDEVISINLSGDSINDREMLSYILDERAKFDTPFENICFEITETIAISNMSNAIIFMNTLKEYGCKFALDDFGSGLSSFSYLKNLPVDYLKIDGSIVRDVCHDEIDRAMLTSIHQIGDFMSLKTVAEKVENEDTLNVLKEIGVDYVQGFYLGKPVPMST